MSDGSDTRPPPPGLEGEIRELRAALVNTSELVTTLLRRLSETNVALLALHDRTFTHQSTIDELTRRIETLEEREPPRH